MLEHHGYKLRAFKAISRLFLTMESKLKKVRKHNGSPAEIWVVKNGAMAVAVCEWLSEHVEYQDAILIIVGAAHPGQNPLKTGGIKPLVVSNYLECDKVLSSL